MRKYQLTERDIAVIVDVYKYRYLSVSQVQRLYFSSRRTSYRRLQALTHLNYLEYFTVPNIPERVFRIAKGGVNVVAGQLGVEEKALTWSRKTRTPKDYYFLKHFLQINDFRIALTLGVQQSEITLLGFIPDYYGERTEQGSVSKYIKDFACDMYHPSRKISHTPDGVFSLEKAGKAALFFLEIDRGTESISNPEKGVLKHITFYLNYLVEGGYNRYQQDFQVSAPFKHFRLVFVTTSAERLQHIREVVSHTPFQPENAKRFLWGTTSEHINHKTILTPIWQALDITDTTRYKIG